MDTADDADDVDALDDEDDDGDGNDASAVVAREGQVCALEEEQEEDELNGHLLDLDEAEHELQDALVSEPPQLPMGELPEPMQWLAKHTRVPVSAVCPRLPALMPVYAMKRRFVRIDNIALRRILPKELLTTLRILNGMDIAAQRAERGANAINLHHFFRMPHRGGGWTPSGSIMTDGVALVVVYQRTSRPGQVPRTSTAHTVLGRGTSRRTDWIPGQCWTPVQPIAPLHDARMVLQDGQRKAPKMRVIAVDPGGITLVYAIERLANGKYREWKLSGHEWRALRGATAHVQRTKHWLRALVAMDAYTAYAKATPRTANPDSLRVWLAAACTVQPLVLRFKLQKKWAEEAFRQYCAARGVLMRFWARVKAGHAEDGTAAGPGHAMDVHVAYGDAVFPSSGRGRLPTPTVAAFKAAVTVFGEDKVHLVREYHTSKCCCDCGKVLQLCKPHIARPGKMGKRTAMGQQGDGVASAAAQVPQTRPRRVFPIRGLRRCTNRLCPAKGLRLRDRDRNAAINILIAFGAESVGWHRPWYLDPRFAHDLPVPDKCYIVRPPACTSDALSAMTSRLHPMQNGALEPALSALHASLGMHVQ